MGSSCVLQQCYGVQGFFSRHCAPGVHTAPSGLHRAAMALPRCCGEAALAGECHGALG